MNPLCTSFPLRPRRIARTRAARATAWLLAFVLIASHVASGALLPEAVGKMPHGASNVAADMHMHCAEHGAQASTSAHSHHGSGAPCCRDKSCTCAQACVVPAFAMIVAMPPPPARVFAIASSRVGSAIQSRLLRPPIA